MRDFQVPELITNYSCETGENPLWHPLEKRLYWCDIPSGRMFRYSPETGLHESVLQKGILGGFTIEADGALLLFMAGGSIQRWHEGELTTIVEGIDDERDSRFNDVIADPRGRVFCGTMPTPTRPGRLYKLDCDGSLTIMLEGIGCANGMAFSRDLKRMYFTDSDAREIYVFDYEESTGFLSNRRVFVSTRGEDGLPDGATIDVEGYLWSARWDGSCIVRYAPDGQEERRISMPVKKVSSITFGGENYEDLYVTSAGALSRSENGPDAGALFRLRTGIRGVPEFHSRICSGISGQAR